MARQRRSDWRQVVAGYRASGMTQEAFCARDGLALTTLQSWLYRPEPSKSATPTFLPVAVRESASPVELRIPSGMVLRFSVGADAGYVAELARRLSAC